MFKARLTKIESTHNNLRSDVIEGLAINTPEAGESFVLYETPAETVMQDTLVRQIRTSPVQQVRKAEDGALVFYTLNSVYRLEKL